MAKLHGKLFSVYVAGVKVGDSRECTLNVNQEVIKIVSKDDNNWEGGLPGVRNWSIAVDFIHDNTNSLDTEDIIDLLLDATNALVEFSQGLDATTYWYGQAYADTASLTAPMGYVNGTLNFIGLDALNKATIASS